MTSKTTTHAGVFFTRIGNAVYATGNTFEHKDALKRAGFSYDKREKTWAGGLQAAVDLQIGAQSWRIAKALGIPTKTKVGGKRVVK